MRKIIWTLGLWFALASTTNAQAVGADYTAERMLELCKGTVSDGDKGMQSMVCTFRMQGVIAIMVQNCLSAAEGFDPLPLLTSGTPPSRGAARQAFVNFMEANPDKWALPWHSAVSLALSESFPCKQ